MSHALLTALLLVAVAFDVHSRRIPNTLVLSGLTAALAIHSFAMFAIVVPVAGAAWWSPLAGAATGLALMLPLHLLRAMGAGDVKLMAMVGAFIGPAAVANATLYTLLAGGLLSLLFMFGRGVAAQTLTNIRFMLTDLALRRSSGQGQNLRLPPLQTTAARLPYALAIALGTGSALAWPLRGF
jgi:prepilin peptidase CpaA